MQEDIENGKNKSYSIKYIMVYHHNHSNIVYNLIKPFTQDDNLFKKLLDIVVFIDTESQIPLTHEMQEEFSKITGSPALINTIYGEVITDLNSIMMYMNDVYNDCIMSLNTNWNSVFGEEYKGDDHYISEQLSANDFYTSINSSYINDYTRQYQEANKSREKYNFTPQVVANGEHNVQIKDSPMANLGKTESFSSPMANPEGLSSHITNLGQSDNLSQNNISTSKVNLNDMNINL